MEKFHLEVSVTTYVRKMYYYLYMHSNKLYGIFSTRDKAKQAIHIFAQKYKELYVWEEYDGQETKAEFDKDVELFVSYFISDFEIVESPGVDYIDTKLVEDYEMFPSKRRFIRH